MKKSRLVGAVCVFLIVISINVNAVIRNTLNGIDYEWLELTATTNMSRDQVEAQLMDENSALYGYEYASRALVEDLLLSYTPWDGIDGWHGAPDVITGTVNLFNDFGVTEVRQNPHYELTKGMYGLEGECVEAGWTCVTQNFLQYDDNDTPILSLQEASNGYDSTFPFPDRGLTVFAADERGSFLVKILSPVTIDIKPGSDPVCNGVTPVAILGSDTLDVIQIDQTTLSFEGKGVRERGNGALSCNIRDANRDGYDDLVCRYEDTTTEGTLTGELLDGTPIEGTDTFCLGN